MQIGSKIVSVYQRLLAKLSSKADLVDGKVPAAQLPSMMPSASGSDEGKVLSVTDSSGTVGWAAAPSELPALTGKAGKVLKVNSGATGVSWENDENATYSFSTGLTNTSGTITVTKPVPATSSSDNGKVLGVTNSSGTIGWVDQTASQVQTDWNATTGMGVLLNKPTLATVATSGSYNDLTDKPTIPDVSGKVSSSGDTMTGNLVMSSGSHAGEETTDSHNAVTFSSDSGNLLLSRPDLEAIESSISWTYSWSTAAPGTVIHAFATYDGVSDDYEAEFLLHVDLTYGTERDAPDSVWKAHISSIERISPSVQQWETRIRLDVSSIMFDGGNGAYEVHSGSSAPYMDTAYIGLATSDDGLFTSNNSLGTGAYSGTIQVSSFVPYLLQGSSSGTTYTFSTGLTESSGVVTVTKPVPSTTSSDSGKVLGVTNSSGTLGWVSQPSISGKQDAITASGILKGNGSGTVSAAVAGTDYQAPLPSTSGNSGKVLGVTNTSGTLGWVSQTAAQVQTDWNATTGMGVLLNKPTSLSAASGGTAHSLVTTGEKYTWNSKADGSHTHGNITNGGDITATAPTIASGDCLVINDDSASKITNGPSFGSSTTTFLANNGTWQTPAGTYSLPTASTSTLGGVKVDGTTITISNGVITSVGGGGGGGGSQELRYAIVTPTVTASTTDSANDTISATMQDRAVNIVTVGSGIDYVNLTFPAKTQGYARDFFVRLVLTGTDVPAVEFSESGGGDVEFDVDDDSWAEIELGVNLLMFTETSQPASQGE